MRSVASLHAFFGKTVLVRVDYNVPLVNGKVIEDEKIRASIPTLAHVLGGGARVVLVSHLGRPAGRFNEKYSLAPVAKALQRILGESVEFFSYKETTQLLSDEAEIIWGRPRIALLENIRFFPAEEAHDSAFAAQLARLGDMFVLDGFGVAHRNDASVAGVPKHLSSCAGLLLEKEVAGLSQVLLRPKKPFVLVLGGIKMETKIPVLKHLLPKTTTVLAGGGVANTMFAAFGYGIGDSVYDEAEMVQAKQYTQNKKVVLPIDVVVGDASGKHVRVVPIPKKPQLLCKKGEAIFDIGPATIRLFSAHMKKAKTIVWNGAMGYMEQKPYHHGTYTIARTIAAQAKGRAFCVAGGGETVQALHDVHMSHHLDLLSTGGGAMLEYLSGKTLPGIAAIEAQTKRRLWFSGRTAR